MESQEQAARLRREIARIKAASGKPRFDAALRAEVVAWVRGQLAAGATADGICDAVGLAANTLRRWAREDTTATVPHTTFIPLTVRTPDAVHAPLPASSLRVYGPAGLRVEGLDRDGLVARWRGLA